MNPKYKVGDRVWIIKDGKAKEEIIIGVFADLLRDTCVYRYAMASDTYYRPGTITMEMPRFKYTEKDVYPTREELIKSL